ncbi:hypothetical protein L2E82_50009 [Cichorium intybus]|nr:hypothetical protein L2E82_50009 [Cichorium intybus]
MLISRLQQLYSSLLFRFTLNVLGLHGKCGEISRYSGYGVLEPDITKGTSWNILRPETVESLFYLWHLIGNKIYQEYGWNIFQAFEKNYHVEAGYVGLKVVFMLRFSVVGGRQNMIMHLPSYYSPGIAHTLRSAVRNPNKEDEDAGGEDESADGEDEDAISGGEATPMIQS